MSNTIATQGTVEHVDPDATAAAGFRAWQAKGSQVRKGEHGIRIFGYRLQKVTEEDDNGEELEKSVTRFPVLTVFDIGQTDPSTARPTVPPSPMP